MPNRPLTEEEKKKISETLKRKYASGEIKSRKGSKMTDEQRKATSEATKKAMWRPEVREKFLKGVKSKERSKKISEFMKGKQHTLGLKRTDKNKKKISETRKKLFKEGKLDLSGENNPMYGKSPSKKCGRGKKTYYKDICFRSTWEAKVAEWLDKNNFIWKYEEKRYKLSNGKTYVPDFFIYDEQDNLLKIIEVKGYVDEVSIEKKMLLEQQENFHVEIWNKEKLTELKIL